MHQRQFKQESAYFRCGVFPLVATLAIAIFASSCTSSETEDRDYPFSTIDTLESGEVVVHNEGVPLWSNDNAWRVEEQFRIGHETHDDALNFGEIQSFDVDAHGRIYVLDRQTQEVFVIGPTGELLRTFGGMGTGPGEFESARAVDVSSDGHVYVMEMQKGQLSILDSLGQYMQMQRINSVGWDYYDYPGGFDRLGRYNAAVIVQEDDESDLALARFDASFSAIDTVAIPESPVEIEYFTWVSDDGGSTMRAGIRYQESFEWGFSASGNFWTLLTKAYQLAEVIPNGQVLRTITTDYQPIAVTSSEREDIREGLNWFTSQGGKIDMSRVPSTKPAAVGFFSDDEGHLWVQRVMPDDEMSGRFIDVFNSTGIYLGQTQLPFDASLEPIFRNGLMYVVSRSSEGAHIVIVAQVVKP